MAPSRAQGREREEEVERTASSYEPRATTSWNWAHRSCTDSKLPTDVTFSMLRLSVLIPFRHLPRLCEEEEGGVSR